MAEPGSLSGLIADVAQSVERVLGKDEVTSSILVIGSSFFSVPHRYPLTINNNTFQLSRHGCHETR